MEIGTDTTQVIRDVDIHIYWLRNGLVDLWVGSTHYPKRSWESVIKIIQAL